VIDLKQLRDPEYVEALERAAVDKRMPFDVAGLVAADVERREVEQRVTELRADKKAVSDGFRSATPDEREQLKERSNAISAELEGLEERLREVEARVHDLALQAPSIPDPIVPVGETDQDNEELYQWGTPRQQVDGMRDHVELVELLGLAEFERAVKVAGARAYALSGKGALLGRALLDLALDLTTARGFRPVIAPVLVTEEAMVGTGYFPLGVEDAYKTDREDRYLVGTSEVSLVSLYRDEVLDASTFPIRDAGLSSCFRREAGAHGKDTRGLYRVHQFEKVEQVIITHADRDASAKEHALLRQNAELLLQALELPYRVALACTGDMGQGQVLKHEIETWMPSRGAYSETHSCSSFYDFQGRRSNIRYRDEDGKMQFAFTLNNTALAIPRAIIPLVEHYQQDDGSVVVPTALRPYLNGAEVLTPDTRTEELVKSPIDIPEPPAGL
jgi:seryl-tRNA synthetase